MSKSKAYKAYSRKNRANGKAVLSFAEWVKLADRLVKARAAIGSTPAPVARASRKNSAQAVVAKVAAAPKAEKAPFARIASRVDCFANQGGHLLLGVDLGQEGILVHLLNGQIVGPYTSKRGERVRVSVAMKADKAEAILTSAGMNPRGF